MENQQPQEPISPLVQPPIPASDKPKRKWHIILPLLLIVGILLYAGISYLVISKIKPGPRLFSTPSPTPAPEMTGEQLKQEIKKAKDRALEKPSMKIPNTDNAILERGKDFQIDYVGKDDLFNIILYRDFDKNRQLAEDHLINTYLQTSDKQVICAVNVLIYAHPKSNPQGKWGPFRKLSVCAGGQQKVSFFDTMIPKAYAQACINVWSYFYYCSCAFLQPYFGNRTWAARLIAARESACNPNASGPFNEGGLFQILIGASYDPNANAAQAAAMSGGGTNFTPWTTCSFMNANDCSGPAYICFPGPDNQGFASSCPPPTYNISGLVYKDYNKNGRPDAGDQPFSNFFVHLQGIGGGLTNSGGNYLFRNISSGWHNVFINVPANYVPSTSTLTGVNGPPDVSNINFGLIPPFNISGLVYKDHNHNGIPDFGDQPFPGVWVNLQGIGGMATNSIGNYIFRNLREGWYNVFINIPSGYLATTSYFRGVGGPPDANNINFGLVPVYTISGRVYNDLDRSGTMTEGDWLYSGGVTVRLSNGTTTTTDGNGYYKFDNLYAGTYDVSITLPTNYINTTANPINVSVGPNKTINFGITNFFRVSGKVFVDENRNGLIDADESIYPGPITIQTTAGTVRISGGTYTVINIPPGEVTISYPSLPTDFFMTYPLNGPPPSFRVTVGPAACTTNGARGASCSGGDITDLNFGISDLYPWIQSTCGNVRIDNGITNRIPQNPVGGPYFILNNSSCTRPGIAHMGDSTYNFWRGTVSSEDWIVGGTRYPEVYKPPVTGSRTSYTYLLAKTRANNITPINLASVCSLNNCTLPVNLPHGIYLANSDVTLNAFTAPANQNYIFLINGNLTLQGDIIVPSTSTIFFSTADDITVAPTVGVPANSTIASLQGVYSTDTSFNVPSAGTCVDERLNIAGNVITNAGGNGGAFQNRRDLCGSDDSYPTVAFYNRLDFLFNLPEFVRIQRTVTWEAAP